MIPRNKILKYSLLLTVSLFVGMLLYKRFFSTEKFEEDTPTVIGNLKNTIDGILSREPADEIVEDDQEDDDEEDDEDDEMIMGSA